MCITGGENTPLYSSPIFVSYHHQPDKFFLQQKKIGTIIHLIVGYFTIIIYLPEIKARKIFLAVQFFSVIIKFMKTMKKLTASLLLASSVATGVTPLSAHADTNLDSLVLPGFEASTQYQRVDRQGLNSLLGGIQNALTINPTSCSSKVFSFGIPANATVHGARASRGIASPIGEAIVEPQVPSVDALADIYTRECSHLMFYKSVYDDKTQKNKVFKGTIDFVPDQVPAGLPPSHTRVVRANVHLDHTPGVTETRLNGYIGFTSIKNVTVAIGALAPHAGLSLLHDVFHRTTRRALNKINNGLK